MDISKIFFYKDFYIILMYLIVGIPIVCLIVKMVKAKDNEKKKKLSEIIGLMLFIFTCMPVEKMADKIPLKFDNVEDAFRFDYSYKFKMVYKERYKDTYFVVGEPTDMTRPFDRFACYTKTKNGWRTLVQPSKVEYESKKSGDIYELYYFNNKKDNVTGVFVITHIDKYSFDENTKISDKYGTEFKYIVDKNNRPIRFGNRAKFIEGENNIPKDIVYEDGKCYIYFGIVEGNIEDDYDLKIDY